VATFFFSALLFHWFTPSGQDCGLNTFIIVMTLVFAILFAIVALHPAVSNEFQLAENMPLFTLLCLLALHNNLQQIVFCLQTFFFFFLMKRKYSHD